jgi:intracellular multiplication protein IcmE
VFRLKPDQSIPKRLTEDIYTSDEIHDAGCSLEQMRLIGISPKELKPKGYSASDLKTVYDASEIITGGYSPQEIQAAGYSIREMTDGGLTLRQLRAMGYTATQLKKAGYDPKNLISEGYSRLEVSVNYPLDGRIVTPREAKALTTIGKHPWRLRVRESITEMISACNAVKSLEKKIRPFKLKLDGFTAFQFKEAGFHPYDLSRVFSLRELLNAGYSLKKMKYIACCQELKEMGYNTTQLRIVGYSPRWLREGGYSTKEIDEAGYSFKEMKDNQICPGELRALGYTPDQLMEGGWSPKELKEGGFTTQELRQAGGWTRVTPY